LESTATSKKSVSWEIRPESFWLRWKMDELWLYRHLLLRIVRRDFLIHHQQTVLGPLWIIFQPIIMLIIYVLIFEKAVGLSTDGLPSSLFYLSGIILWNLFAECFTGTSFTFIQNGSLFGKIYFPRLIIPLSVVLVNLTRFGIQFMIFLGILVFVQPDLMVAHPLRTFISFVCAIVIVPGLGLGLGLIFSIATAKYRDLVNVIHLISRLLMFATPIIYPLSIVNEEFQFWVALNPLTSAVELFRFGFLGQGTFTLWQLGYSGVCTSLVLIGGVMLFSKFGNKLQDVI
jgi:lipopolysaccharide transport system permease protein